MNGEQSALLEILNAIEHGNLSTEETRRRLEELIDNEINKTNAPANMKIVDECEKLLWELNTKGNLPFISKLESNKHAVIKRINKSYDIKRIAKFSIQVASIVAVLFISIISLDIVFHKEWIVHHSTSDNQQYIIQGQTYDPNIVDSASATEDQKEKSLSTTNYSNVIHFLGFDPLIDNHISSEWVAEKYACFVSYSNSTFRAYYKSERGEIRLIIDYFDDIGDIKTFIEQNNDGCQSQIRNYNVYYTTNNGTTVATWTSEIKIYKIASDSLSSEEVLLFIKTFYGV